MNQPIVDGIKGIISHHTRTRKGGTRTIASETFVKNVVVASLFGVVKEKKDVSNHSLSSFIGVSFCQIKRARITVQDLITNDSDISVLGRKKRQDHIRKAVLPSVFKFCLDDDYTRLDSNQGLDVVVNPRTGEDTTVHRRIWAIQNKRQQHLLFLCSNHYTKF